MEYEDFRNKMNDLIQEIGKEEFFIHLGNYSWKEHGYLFEEVL